MDRKPGKYSFNHQWALAARGKWIKSTSSLKDGAFSVLKGPGSSAWSLRAQPEGSCVHVYNSVPGFRLGPDFDNKSQVRGLIEAGVIF